jgi:uncharacterized protein YdbL (DUF1318 family)
MNKEMYLYIALAAAVAANTGCLSVKTEHEVKPIQITMDVNLKLDKALEQELENEKKAPPKHFEQVKAMFKRAAVGMDNRGYIAVRGDLTDEEKEIVEDANAKRRVRMGELAEQTGAKRADVEKMRAEKMVDHLSEGAWYQDAEGKWLQKK